MTARYITVTTHPYEFPTFRTPVIWCLACGASCMVSVDECTWTERSGSVELICTCGATVKQGWRRDPPGEPREKRIVEGARASKPRR